MQKKEMRELLKLRRENLDRNDCEAADEAILKHLKEMSEYRKAEVIFCYVSTPGEVNTWQLIREALQEEKRIVVPRCEAKGIMEACEISSLDDLEPGRWGIYEPKESCKRIRPDQIDLCAVPCIAADRRGVRLGYGGGYYDRYLPKTRASRAVLCREKMICENLPEESHDCLMDAVITENGCFFVKRS